MRSSLVALSLSLLPVTGCINLDLANGEANVVQTQVDISGAGFTLFADQNINFKQVITLDLSTDEQRVGALAVDDINFNEPIQIEISYVLEDMIRLEDFLESNNPDPRGLQEGDDPALFQVGDAREFPYQVTMSVTFPRKDKIVNDNGRVRRVRGIETRTAFCNFIDPLVADRKGCFKFEANVTEGVESIIGSVAGVNGENTISATFEDIIVVDDTKYFEIIEDSLLATGEFPAAEELAESILVRIARDEPGTAFIFNANLDGDFE